MREAGAVLAEVMGALIARVAPGVSTGELDSLAEAELRARKAKPAFLGYRGFPAALCASVNQEVVHGIPGTRVASVAKSVEVQIRLIRVSVCGAVIVSIRDSVIVVIGIACISE